MADGYELEIGENNQAQSMTQLVLGLGNPSTTLQVSTERAASGLREKVEALVSMERAASGSRETVEVLVSMELAKPGLRERAVSSA